MVMWRGKRWKRWNLPPGTCQEDWLLSVRRHGLCCWCPLQGRRGREQASAGPPTHRLAEAGRPTITTTNTTTHHKPPLPTCCLSIPSMLWEWKALEAIEDLKSHQELKSKLGVPPTTAGIGGRRGEGILTHLPSCQPRWLSHSWESQLCWDNTDAVRDGNAIGQSNPNDCKTEKNLQCCETWKATQQLQEICRQLEKLR